MDTNIEKTAAHRSAGPSLDPRSPILAPYAFTLVELLVVITIIGILASLITIAAVGALKTAQQTRIKTELNQISEGIEEYKNKYTAYPPNCQTDDTSGPLDEAAILNDVKQHLRQIAPKHREPDALIAALAGLAASTPGIDHQLAGGLSSGEAIVFWLGGFSSDPKYPISGEGGPSYPIQSFGNAQNRTLDPLSTRKWVFPFEVSRLGPRASGDEYFDQSQGRYIEYQVNTGTGNQLRRINFWQYTPAKSKEPYLYFDTSRHPAYDTHPAASNAARFDPPAATAPSQLGPQGDGMHVHALKKRSDSTGATAQIQFVDPAKFQVLHCGIDDAWDTPDFENFEQMSVHKVGPSWDEYLLFPTGPFIGEIADTAVNFTTEAKLEDAQP